MTFSYGLTALRATLGQALINETTTYSHAFVVLANGEIIEPWPSGARHTALEDYEDEYVAYGFLPDLTYRERMSIAAAALSLDGVGHGLLDYAAVAAHRYGWRVPPLARRMASPRSLLPAQFVAEAYRRAGLELLPGFAPGDITLGDLGSMMINSEVWELRVPCVEFGVRTGRAR